MPPESPPLPPKPEVALALLQTASSVYVHLDPRGENVMVPPWFKNQPQLVLQIGLNMAVPIPDLDVGKDSISCTLSFNRRPEFCSIPWDAIYGLVGEDGRGMIWPESIPPEVAAAAEGRASTARKPHLRVAGEEKPSSERAGEVPSSSAAGEKPPQPAAKASRAKAGAGRGKKQKDVATTHEVAMKASKPGSVSATPTTPAHVAKNAESGKRRELPPYLRIVK